MPNWLSSSDSELQPIDGAFRRGRGSLLYNIGLGSLMGGLVGVGLILVGIARFLVVGPIWYVWNKGAWPSTSRPGFFAVAATCVIGGMAAGAVAGTLVGFARSAPGAIIVGIIAASPFFLAVGIVTDGWVTKWSSDAWIASILATVSLGGLSGYKLWEDDELENRPSPKFTTQKKKLFQSWKP